MHTVNEMFDKYEKERLPELSARTKVDYSRHIRKLRQTFGEKDVRAVTRKEISDFMDVPKGKIQRNRMLAVLSAAFREALGWGWVEGNPCTLIERHASKPKERHLTEQEFEAAKAFIAKGRRDRWQLLLVMDLARHTGQLQDDIITLRWSQVDEAAGIILFRHHITRKKVPVPITKQIASVLSQAKKRTGGREYVITTGRTGTRYSNEGFRAMWQRLMRKWGEKTGNDKFTFHDIRRLAPGIAEKQNPSRCRRGCSWLPAIRCGGSSRGSRDG